MFKMESSDFVMMALISVSLSDDVDDDDVPSEMF
jgi:hypothetical protein